MLKGDDPAFDRQYASAVAEKMAGRIAEVARSRGRRVIPHGYKTNIEIAANLHFLACQPEESMLEYSLSPSPLRWNTTIEPFPVEEDGTVIVPDRPGLGVTLNMETVRRYAWPRCKSR